ncbi:MAG: FxsA family protein [Rhodospirillaceae bacterium]|nr:FxsA family protein [Rhodospirillaceae bacterium]MCY4238706.1 FxsA family protein [Rhodospirillaceae bacterium]MCY4310064.1 FxsA family protein [Rhodospirillaceae bacterium]
MGWILFALLIGVPLIEIYLFVKVGGSIGAWPTIALVILTAIAGSIMLRAQGRTALARARDKIERNEPPVTDILDGIGILLAGALLLTPGFLTDILGFSMLLPPVRATLATRIWMQINLRSNLHHRGSGRPGSSKGGDGVIDGDFEHVDSDSDNDFSKRGDKNRPWLQKH